MSQRAETVDTCVVYGSLKIKWGYSGFEMQGNKYHQRGASKMRATHAAPAKNPKAEGMTEVPAR